MKKLFSEKLKEFKLGVVQSFKNSPVEIIISILFFALFVVDQYASFSDKHIGSFVSCFPIVFGLIYALNLFFKSSKLRIIYYLAFLIIIPIVFYLKIEDEFSTYLVAILTSILLIFLAKKDKENNSFATTLTQLAVNIGIALILSFICFMLIFLIFGSIWTIFEIGYDNRIIKESLFLGFSSLMIAPLIFLVFDYNKQKIYFKGKIETILIKYILTPSLFIFGIILYIYFAKILFTFSLPKGVVSATAIGFILIALIIKTYSESFENPFHKWFFSYFTYWSLPSLIMLWIATIYRINEYGFSLLRIYLLLTAIALTIWAFSLLFKVKRKYYYLTIFTIVLFNLFTFVPYINAKSIEKYSQDIRIEKEKHEGKGITKKDVVNAEDNSIYMSNFNEPVNIQGYNKLIKLNWNKVEGSWYCLNDDKKIRIYNDKDSLVFEQPIDNIILRQINNAKLTKTQLLQIRDEKKAEKEVLIKKYSDKLFEYELPTMKIVFSELHLSNDTSNNSSVNIDYILLK